jgi:hypothetical protein
MNLHIGSCDLHLLITQNGLNKHVLYICMVFVGECDFCGEQNVNPPNSGFTFSRHHMRTFIRCNKEVCKKKHANTSCRYEISIDRFRQYILSGPTKDINIERSSGLISKAEIKIYQEIDSDIMIHKKNITFYVEFIDDDYGLKCKFATFDILANINTHLPLITIQQSRLISRDVRDELLKYQRELDIHCILINKATRLMLISFVKNNGYFSRFPRELFSMILTKYYEL